MVNENAGQEVEANTIDNSLDGSGSVEEAAVLAQIQAEWDAEKASEDTESEETPADKAEVKDEKEEDKPKEEEKKVDDKLASKFAALSRKEKDLIAKEKSIKAEVEKVEAFRKGLSEGKENPKEVLKLLNEHGIDFDTLARAAFEDQTLDKDLKLASIEKKIEEAEKRRLADIENAKKQATEAAIGQFKSDIDSFIKTNADQYELVADGGHAHDVFELIALYAQSNNGALLSIEKATQLTEDFLFERMNKTLKLKKFSNLKEKSEDIKLEAKDTKTSKPTLTNSNSASPKAPKVRETDADRKAAAEKILLEAWKSES